VTVTCCRSSEARWSWRLTKESGRRPSAGCVQHVRSSIEDVRGAYAIMEFDTTRLRERDIEWWCIVGQLDRRTLVTIVAIADAFKVAESALRTGAGQEIHMGSFVFALVEKVVFDGWFSRCSSICRCSAVALFTEGRMCKSCASGRGLYSSFVSQDCFIGVHPFGRRHWWKGVTDGVSDVASWRTALYGIGRGGVLEVCSRCVLM
jgi:hypothetical protein